MKRLALLVALLWWAQTPLCLFVAGSHGHGSEVAADQHHHDGHGGKAPVGPGGEGQPGDSSCAEHCASLAQAVPTLAASGAVPAAGFAALPRHASAIVPVAIAFVRSAERFRDPFPDPSRHSSVLRL